MRDASVQKTEAVALRVDWPLRGHGYTEDEIAAVVAVMRARGQALTSGSEVQRFEQSAAA
jgi:hypothetical protein